MGVGAGLYVYDVVVKKDHVRYHTCWWFLVLVFIKTQWHMIP